MGQRKRDFHGVSHKAAPVELRERLSIPVAGLPAALRSLLRRVPDAECVILPTYNRVAAGLESMVLGESRIEGYLARLEGK